MDESLIRFSYIIKIVTYCFLFSFIIQVECQNQFENQQIQEQSAHVTNEYQAPYGAQLPNEVGKQFRPHMSNIDTMHVAQFPNNFQLPNVAQLKNDVPLSDDSLNPSETVIPDLFIDFITNAFSNYLKLFLKMFSDFQKDTRRAIKSGLKPNVSLECLDSLKDLLRGTMERKLWAVRMIDSFGKIPSGISDGNTKAYGDFDMCVDTIIPDFQGMYCLINVVHVNSHKIVSFEPQNLSYVFNRDYTRTLTAFDEIPKLLGILLTTSICLPSKCSERDIQNGLSKVFTSYTVLQSFDVKVKDCIIKHEVIYNSTQKTIMFVILALILFGVFATFIDVRLRNIYGDQFNTEELSKTVQCILAFSYYSNTITLFKKDEKPDSLKIFHGMKFFSQAWVIWGHTVFCMVLVLGRMYEAVIIWSSLSFQTQINGFFATESYFFISGFIVVYSYVKANCPRVNFIIFVLLRYIRLMPSFLFILGCILLSENLFSGPIWKQYVIDHYIGSCKKTWWKNLLLFNNTEDMIRSCLPWTWYIAVDMQLYTLSYLMLLLIKRNPKKALWLLKVIIVANVIGLMFYNVAYNLPPMPVLTYVGIENISYFTKMIHFGTYSHVTPYCMGMIMGYFIATKKKINLSKTKKLLGWCVAIFSLLIGFFSPYIWNHNGRVPTVTESALYGGTHRLLWSLMLSWIVYLCSNGEAGKIKSFLSADLFVPLSRLTYVTYLVHPLIQMLTFGQFKYVIVPDNKFVTIIFLGFIVSSYMFAYLVRLICELPFSRLFKIFISIKLGESDKKSK